MGDDKEQRTIEIILKAQDANASLKEMAAGAAVMTAQLSRMGQDDPGRAKLLGDLQGLNQRLGAARAEMRELGPAQMQVIVDGQKVSATFNEMKVAGAQLEKQLGDLSHDDPGRKQMLADYKALQLRIEEVKNEMGQTAPKASLFKQALGMAGIVVSAEAVVDVVKSVGMSVFETTSKFETFDAVLTNALGSKSAAQLALHDIQTLAATTPFGVDELTSSFIKFVNRGLKPSMEDLKKLADIAASQGKSFDQLTEAVLDAGTGEFERLKEFGIQASKSGDQVSLSFKGTQKTVANTPEAIQGALLAFGELDGVMGTVDAISKTLEGSTSNLGDSADQAALQWGTVLMPVFKGVIGTLAFLIGVLGAIPAFIIENRGLLLGLAGAVLTLNFASVAATASTLAHIAVEKARAIATRASAAAQWLLNVAMEANPIGLVVAAVVLLVGAFITLYEKSAVVRSAISGLGQALVAFVTTYVQGVIKAFNGLGNVIMGALTMDPARLKKGVEEGLSGLKGMYFDAGVNAASAFGKGYDEKMASEQAKQAQSQVNAFQVAQTAYLKHADAAAKARQAAEDAARLQALQHEEADLKVRLASVEEGTRAEMKLKQQLTAVQAKLELEDAKKTEDQKRVIRAEAQGKISDLEQDFNKKLAAQRKAEHDRLVKEAEEVAKKQLAVEHSLQDLRVAVIRDDHQRELAELALQTQRKIEALQGSEAEIIEQKNLLLEQRRQKEEELLAKWAEEDAKKQEEYHQQQAELNEAADEEYAAYLENKVAHGLMAEQDYQQALYNLKKQALDDQLALLVKNGKAETAEAKRIRAEQYKLDTDHVKQEEELKKKQHQFELQMAAASAGILKDSLDFLLDNIEKQGFAYEAFKILRKSAALAEIGLNLAMEMSTNAKTTAEYGPILGLPALTIANGLSIARATLAGIKVAAFADGGPTNQLVKQLPIGALAGLLSGGRQAPGGTFAGGGPVGQATLGLIGEAGPELVIPNWLYSDPKQANLMGFLEATIASKGNAFAIGGSTTGSSGVVAGTTSTGPDFGQLVGLVGQLVQSHQEFRDEISNWQRDLAVSLDLPGLSKKLDTVKQVQTGGGIR